MEEADQEARDALIAWRTGRVESDLDKAPGSLWHYTDGGGLQGILATEEFWASDARFLNDAAEISYGLEVADEAVRESARSGRWTASTSHFLERVMAPDGANLTGFLRARSEVYVACLCEEGDLLSQWRSYAGRDTAGGYALQFRHRAPVTGWIDHLGRERLRLQRVLYDRGDQLAVFSDLIELLARVYNVDHSERRMAAVTRNLIDGILEFATLCKHPSFREEREWRIVYERSSDAHPLEIRHRISRGLFIPYVALKLPAAVGAMAGHLPIVEVRCGPSLEPQLKQDGVKRLLHSFETYKVVKVSGSDSPVRL